MMTAARTLPAPVPRNAPRESRRIWASRMLSALPVTFLVFDSAIKLIVIDPVVESFTRLGYPVSVSVGIGLLELACVVVYLIPRTAVLGAILLTGFLGGAVATHVRVGDPLFSHVLSGVYVGALLWAGLWLRDEKLRALVPVRRAHASRRNTST